jgi:hypothetical protein
MKKLLCVAGLLGSLSLAGCSHPRPVAYYPPPPLTGNQVAQQGYHDGFEAARHDIAVGRPLALARHPRYRNPPVPPPAIGEYRQAFRDGYERFLHPGPPAPPPGA